MIARTIPFFILSIVGLLILSGCNRINANSSKESSLLRDLIVSAPTGSGSPAPAELSGGGAMSAELNDIASADLIISPMELVGNWADHVSSVNEKNGVYEIYTPEELAWVAAQVNNGQSFAGETIKLLADIDLSGKEWTPIGAPPMNSGMSKRISSTFTGTFDGNYKLIKNLSIGTIGKPNPYGRTVDLGGGMTRSGYVGLFGICGEYGMAASETVIRNVGLENVSIHTVASGAGALIGLSWGTYVENCYSTGVIISYAADVTAGGLIAELSAWNNVSVNNCYSTVHLSSTNFDGGELLSGLGGLIGSMGNASEPVVVNCYAIGKTNTAGKRGGILGRGNYSFVEGGILNSYHNADTNKYMVQSVDFYWEPSHEEIELYARTTNELRTQLTYKDWDFINIWGIDKNWNDGYPYLRGFR